MFPYSQALIVNLLVSRARAAVKHYQLRRDDDQAYDQYWRARMEAELVRPVLFL